jgi:hypothetical protein
MGGKDWESEVLKWQMLFGNEWVYDKVLFEAGIVRQEIPVGFYEVELARRFGNTPCRLRTLEEREAMQAKWDKQQELHRKITVYERIQRTNQKLNEINNDNYIKGTK